ncbi:pilus (MSHA type) biogenesis protein MshL [Leptothrix discophora]|uniref:Pilus (MSHA type) biogenesis protein MshL n=1 Tax=Leptothrix discophora TaxID=89 RepID=A0ABT9G8T7_LEPDI|nr:pilus (MSHA type) biogenesis protein MshL [Leptothrix discophora]MDP4302598.1 pilus (MSHA type) biogenesis protein MshL [Leptothrix discophora]
MPRPTAPARCTLPTTLPATLLAAALALSPLAPARAAEARFDLALNQAPAAQVFMQLGMGSDWQVMVSPEVAGSVTLNLRGTTVPEALETLRELYGYEIRISGKRVHVLPNTAQTRLFRINYLPGRRQGTSDLRVSSASITGSGAGNGNSGNSGNGGSSGNASGSYAGGGSGGSASGGHGGRNDDSAYVRTSSDADFWRDVKASLQALLGLDENGADNTGGAQPATPGAAPLRRSLVLNPAAGVVVVRATPAELRQVESYLQAVQVSIERQVMLEAKILEVELGESSQTGINWAAFGRALGGAISVGMAQPGVTLAASGALNLNGSQVTPGSNLVSGNATAPFYGLAFQSTHFAALLSFLEGQGKVQVLSSPRIATLNNQKAVLKVGSDELYVTGVSSTTTSTGSTSTTTPSVVLQPFFSGISLDVTPQIGEDGQVMLHVHPAISTVTEKQKAINLGSLGSYQLPLASSAVNETDSIVRLRDGEIAAIGGLMSQERHEDSTALPGLGELPVVGGLFRQKTTSVRKRELVILIKPTVVRDGSAWPEADTTQPTSRLQPWPEKANEKANDKANDMSAPGADARPAPARAALVIDGTAAPQPAAR